MEDEGKTVTKPRQPSKLDNHPLIPLADFEDRMRGVLSVIPEEIERREAEYQKQQAQKRKSKKAA